MSSRPDLDTSRGGYGKEPATTAWARCVMFAGFMTSFNGFIQATEGFMALFNNGYHLTVALIATLTATTPGPRQSRQTST